MWLRQASLRVTTIFSGGLVLYTSLNWLRTRGTSKTLKLFVKTRQKKYLIRKRSCTSITTGPATRKASYLTLSLTRVTLGQRQLSTVTFRTWCKTLIRTKTWPTKKAYMKITQKTGIKSKTLVNTRRPSMEQQTSPLRQKVKGQTPRRSVPLTPRELEAPGGIDLNIWPMLTCLKLRVRSLSSQRPAERVNRT